MKFHDIKREICKKYGVTVAEFDSKTRRQKVAYARHEAWALARQHTNLSFPQLGRFSGGKDHTTVLYGVHAHIFRTTGRLHPWLSGRLKLDRYGANEND